jgi:lysozyme family protein
MATVSDLSMVRRKQTGMSTDEVLDFIITNFEGTKFINRSDDHGGPTKFGITKQSLSRARGVSVRGNDIHKLTRKEAKAIYIASFVKPVRGDEFAYGPLKLAVIDYAIHSGTKLAIKAIQESVNVMPDGVMGSLTWAAIENHKTRSLFLRLMAHRTMFLTRSIARDARQSVFAYAWGKRLARILESGA